MFSVSKNIFIAAVMFGLLVVAPLKKANADQFLDQGLSQMAKAIKKFLKEERLPLNVVVGTFQGTPRLRSSGGIEISRSIKDQLMKEGIKVSNDAELQLMGKFKVRPQKQHSVDDFESVALQIEAVILDGDDEELAVLPISVFGSVALQIGGANVELPPKANEKTRQKTAAEQLKKPKTSAAKNITRAAATSPFGIEILVNNSNKKSSRPATVDSAGKSFVTLNNKEEYVVRLHNQSDHEVSVSLTIDGVNTFALAKDERLRLSQFIVAPRKFVDIPGWFVTRSNTKVFEVSGYAGSVAEKFGVSADVGTITAVFRASWEPGGTRPSDEPAGNPKGGKATKAGRDINKGYAEVQRDMGVVRSIVSVRYDR